MKPLKSHPEFKSTIQKIKDKFWENQEEFKQSLRAQSLL